jgi:type II secretory pathway pseudopilin PulG
MGRKKLFSLIEIAVAMAVAAIGVAAIMALLPVAVKSTSDSVGDTLATDAANSVIAQLDRAAWEHFEWIQSLKEKKPTKFSEAKAKDYAKITLGADESYKIEPATGLQDGHFAFLFGPPGEAPDFSAEVICWIEKNSDLNLTTFDGKTGKVKKPALKMNDRSLRHPETNKLPFVRVFIEVTWPLTKPYEKGSGADTVYPRQSRLFVREYMDPTYYKPVE